MAKHKQAWYLASLLSCLPAASYGADEPYCRFYAREAIEAYQQRIIKWAENRFWSTCLNADERPDLPPGTAPASLKPVTKPAHDADVIAKCRADYRTFRASDNTVIRNRNKGKRVPCPYLTGEAQ